jgi:hypothetical protein
MPLLPRVQLSPARAALWRGRGDEATENQAWNALWSIFKGDSSDAKAAANH